MHLPEVKSDGADNTLNLPWKADGEVMVCTAGETHNMPPLGFCRCLLANDMFKHYVSVAVGTTCLIRLVLCRRRLEQTVGDIS